MTVEEFREIAMQIPPSHPDTERSFRDECIAHRFLIYDGKKNRAVCTNCGHEWDIAPREYSHMHGLKDICPCCEAELVCVSAGRGRRSYEEQHRLMTFASDGKNLWIVQNDVLVSFVEFGEAQIYRNMFEVFKISADEQRHWRYSEGWWGGIARWDELKTFNPAPLPHAMYFASKWNQHIFREGFEEILQNSDCCFLAGEDIEKALGWTSIATWIALQMRYPALELLRKGGYDKLARHRLTGYGNYQNAINIRGTSIEKALRLPKKWTKALRKAGISEEMTSKELKAFQRLDDKMKRWAIENWKAWAAIVSDYRGDEHAAAITKHTTLEKYLRYMTEQEISDPSFYVDYLENASALGWDLRRKQILFPEDLKDAHDKAADLRDMEKNAAKNAKMAAHAINVDYSANNLMALPAMSQQDLNNESRVLHHCVKTYGDRVADGKTLIYFVRRTSLPDEPYYTLEISPKDGHVVQCRGLKNCSMTAEVQEFKEGFEKAFIKMMKREDTLCRAKA
jgi:hypothetical protein